jgi:glycosyltransferase involved in cell wall biosynthesis
MRIAVWHNLPSGGGKRSLYNHVKALLDLGHSVEVWTTDLTLHDNYLPLNELCTEHILPVAEKIKPYSNSRFAWRQIRSTYNRIRIMKEHCSMCAEQINTGDFDLCFVNPCSLFYISFMGMYLKIPSLIFLQEPNRRIYEAAHTFPFAAKDSIFSIKSVHYHAWLYAYSILANEEQKAAKSYDRILVNSMYSRDSVMRAYDIDARVCYLGTDMEHFKLTNLPKQAYVVGLGLIYHGKGLDRAIKAIATIPKERRPKLVWIGNGQGEKYSNEIRKMATELEVELILKVKITDPELFQVISQAAVMLYTPRLEPFGFAPIEANALGTGVVALAEGGVRETVIDGENGFLAYHDDASTIGKLIEKFTRDLEFSKVFGQRARSLVLENWNLEKMGKSLESQMQTLLQQNSNKDISNQY